MQDPQSTFYIVLSIAIALLTIFLSVTLIYMILILRDTSKMLEKIRDTVEKINTFILKPVSLASSIVEHVKPLIESVLERRTEASEHRSRRK